MASPFAASRRRRAQSDPIEDQVDMELKNAAAMAEDNARAAESDRRRAMAARLAELNAELKARDKAEASTVRGPAGQVLRPESTAAKRVLTDDTTGEQFVQTSTGELEPAAQNAPLFRRNGRLVRERTGMRPVDAGEDPATRDRRAVEENLRLAEESAQIAQTALDQQESQAELSAQESGLDASLAKTRATAARKANEYQLGALPEEQAALTAEERANAARKAAIDTKRQTMGGKAQYGAFENFLKRRKAAVSQIDVSDGRLPDDYLKQFGATKIPDQNTPDGWKERLGQAKKAEAGTGAAVPGSAQVVTPAENQAQQDLSEFEAYGQEIASLYDADDQTLQAKLQDLDGQIEQGNAFLTQGSADVDSRAAQVRTAFDALLLENQQAVQANPDAQHLTVTVGDRKELWTPELYRRREKLVADAKKMDGDLQAMQGELEAESGRLQQVVDMRNTAASVLNDRVTKAKTEQAAAVKAEADRLRSMPHLAEYADDLEQIDRDVETRLAKVREMFPEGGEGARKAVLEEARVSRELLAKNIQETDRAHQKKVRSAYAQVRESLPGVNFNFYGRESQDKEKAFSEYKEGGKALDEQVDTAIWKAAQDSGVPEAEVRKAFEREREYDWTGSPESETSRVLSTGKIAVKPELALDKKAYERAIADADATPEQKAEAYRTMKEDRMKVAGAIAPLLASDEEGFSEKVAKFFGAYPAGPLNAALIAADRGFVAWQKSHPSDKPQTEQILEYFDTQGSGARFLRHMGEAIKSSLTSLSKSAAGAGAAVTDANWLHGLMQEASQTEQIQSEYRQRTGVDANQPKMLGFTPGEAYGTVLQSAPSIVGGAINPAVAAILAGAQSGGGTYADAYQAYKTQGLDEDSARRAARAPAALSAASTGFLTALGGATGAEGLSRVLNNTAQRNALHATLRDRLRTVFKDTAIGALKGASREAFFEEMPDQMIQGMIQQMSYNPNLTVEEYVEQAAKAAVGGFFMGGPFSAITEGVESSRRNRAAEQPAGSSLPPEQWAEAIDDINTFESQGMDPADLERSKVAAEALLYIGRGQAADLSDAMLETVGVQRNAKGELENIKGRKALQVKVENGNPIITDQSLEWLKQYMPGVASTISLDEMGARQMFNGVGVNRTQNATQSPPPLTPTPVQQAVNQPSATSSSATSSQTSGGGEITVPKVGDTVQHQGRPRKVQSVLPAIGPGAAEAQVIFEDEPGKLYGASTLQSGVAPAVEAEPVWSFTDPVGTTHILPKSAASSPVEAAQQFTATTGVAVQPAQVVRPARTTTPEDARTATTSAKVRMAFRALADDAKSKGKNPATVGAIKLAGSLTEKYARQYTGVFRNVIVSDDVPAAASYQAGVLYVNPTIMSGLVKANIKNAEAVVRSIIREEVVHHLIGQTVTEKQLAKLWNDLPPALRTVSRNAYEAAQISNLSKSLGRTPTQDEIDTHLDEIADAQKQNSIAAELQRMREKVGRQLKQVEIDSAIASRNPDITNGEEFLRQLLQKEIWNEVTELARLRPSLAEQIQAVLLQLAEALNNILAKVTNTQTRAEIEGYRDAAIELAEQLGVVARGEVPKTAKAETGTKPLSVSNQPNAPPVAAPGTVDESDNQVSRENSDQRRLDAPADPASQPQTPDQFSSVSDSQLDYLRTGMREDSMALARQRVGNDRPIRIDLHADGTISLEDGRHRWAAAREAGKKSIKAEVRQRDANGDVVSKVIKKVKILPDDNDAAYMKAAKSGDIVNAQALVDQAAIKAGYTVGPVWHGTNQAFDAFETLKGVNREQAWLLGAQFTASQTEAQAIANKRSREDGVPRVINARLNPGKTLDLRDEYAPVFRLGDIPPQWQSRFSRNPSRDADLMFSFNESAFKLNPAELTQMVMDMGYDSATRIHPQSGVQHWIIFDPARVKSAEPITRDNAGKIIPPSQRFNPATPDMRFASADPGDGPSRARQMFEAWYASGGGNVNDRIATEQAWRENRMRFVRKAAAATVASSIRTAQREDIQDEGPQETEWPALAQDTAPRLPTGMATKLGEFWTDISSDPKAFAYPTSNATDIQTIARVMSGGKVTAEVHEGESPWIELTHRDGGRITIKDINRRPDIGSAGADSAGKKDGGGKLMYQIALSWAANNGKRIHPSYALSPINAFTRRTSAMLSSALRYGTTRHMQVDPDQGVLGWRDWRGDQDSSGNIGRLAYREMTQTLRAYPQLSEFRYDFEAGRFERNGQPATPADIEAAIKQTDPAGFANAAGVGQTTAQRAIITQTAMNEGMVADESMTAPERTLYAPADPEQDAEYMAAVEAGDMAKAQKMVDEVARQNGYDVDRPLYHHGATDITEFRMDVGNPADQGPAGTYLSPDPRRFSGFGRGGTYRLYARLINPVTLATPLTRRHIEEAAKQLGDEQPSASTRTPWTDWLNELSTRYIPDLEQSLAEIRAPRPNTSAPPSVPGVPKMPGVPSVPGSTPANLSISSDFQRNFIAKQEARLAAAKLLADWKRQPLDAPLPISLLTFLDKAYYGSEIMVQHGESMTGAGPRWNGPEGVGMSLAQKADHKRKARAYLESLGFDSLDKTGKLHPDFVSYNLRVNRDWAEVVAFRPSQLKSADAITRDADGNIIPPSQRFRQDSTDIRNAPADPGSDMNEDEVDIEALLASLESELPSDAEIERLTGITLSEMKAIEDATKARVQDGMPPEVAETIAEQERADAYKAPYRTSLKRSVVDEERAQRGAAPIATPIARSFGEAGQRAAETLDRDPMAGFRLVKELINEPRATTDYETALLLLHKVNIRHDLAKARNEVNTLEPGSEQNAAKTRYDHLLEDQNDVDVASRAAGTEKGRGLNAQKMMMAEDHSPEALQQTYRTQANHGAPVSPEDQAEVNKHAVKIGAAQANLDAVETQREVLDVEAALQRLAKNMAAEVKSTVKRGGDVGSYVKTKAQAARARLAKLNQQQSGARTLNAPADPESDVLADYGIIGAEYIANGKTSLADFSAAMVGEFGAAVQSQIQEIYTLAQAAHDVAKREFAAEQSRRDKLATPQGVLDAFKTDPSKGLNKNLMVDLARAYIRQGVNKTEDVITRITNDLQTLFPGTTESNVRVILSDYGKTTQPTKDAIESQLSEVKGEARLLESLERASRGQNPLKTGYQRGPMAQRMRELIGQVNQAMRKMGIQTTRENQLATAKQAAKTRLQNQIDDLNAVIEGRSKPRLERQPLQYDAELNELVKVRNELKAVVDQMTGETDDAKWNRAAQRAAKASEEYYRRKIASQDFTPRQTTARTPTAETVKAQEDAAAAREEFRQLRELTGVPQAERLAKQKTRLEQEIAKVQQRLITGERPVPNQKPLPPAEIKALKDTLARLRQSVRLVEGPNQTDTQRAQNAAKAVQRSIDDLNNRINRMARGEADVAKARRAPVTETPELKALREEKARLKEIADALVEAQNPSRLPEEIALDNFRRAVERKQAELQRKLQNKEYLEVVPKARSEVDRAFESRRLDAMQKLEQAKRDWTTFLFQRQLENRPVVIRALSSAGELLNTSRAILTSIDLSAPLRQGGFIAFGNPARAARQIWPMLKAFRSEKYQLEAMEGIRNHPNYALAQQAGLYMTDMGETDLSKMEEMYMSRWVQHIRGWKGAVAGAALGAVAGSVGTLGIGTVPGAAVGAALGAAGAVEASQRAFVTFLNLLRFESFNAMVTTLGRDGRVTKAEGEALAQYINVATGRGIIGMSKTLEGKKVPPSGNPILSTIFFSPRLAASRFNLLFGQPLYGGNARTRTLVAKEYGKFSMGIGIALGLAFMAWQAQDDEDKEKAPFLEMDPRSSDFLKVRFGNTRLDLFGGLLQATVLMSRIISGQTKKRGEIVDLRGPGKPFSGDSTIDVAAKFLRSKLSPAIGSIVNLLQGQDFAGDPAKVKTEAIKMTVPMSLQNIAETMKDQGVPKGTIFTLMSIFGAGLQTYESSRNAPKNPQALNDIVTAWNALHPDDAWMPSTTKKTDYMVKRPDGTEEAMTPAEMDQYDKLRHDRMAEALAKYPVANPKAPTAEEIERIKKMRQTANAGAKKIVIGQHLESLKPSQTPPTITQPNWREEFARSRAERQNQPTP